MNIKRVINIIFVLCLFIIINQEIYAAAPVLNTIPTPQNLTEGVPYSLTIIATDPEDCPLNFSDDTENFNIQKINDTNAIISFTPSNSLIGDFIAVIIVVDNESLVDAQAVNFIINGIPVFDNLANKNVSAESEFSFDIDATDPEDPVTNLTFSDNSGLFNINVSSGEINFTTDTSLIGTYDIIIVVNDSRSANSTGNFSLTINDRPNITEIPGNTSIEDQNFFINISGFVNDSVGNLTFSSDSPFFTINETTGQVNFTANFNETGNYTINFTVTDDFGLNNTKNWSINITAINDAPTFPKLENQTEAIGTRFALQINATDEENDTITYFDNSSFFDINLTTGLINFTINSSMNGSFIINITVNDTNGDAYSDTFNFTIIENTPPLFGKNFTLNITPNVDTYVDANFPDTNYRGNEFLFLSGDSATRRSFLNFSLENLPIIANINFAQVNFTISTNTPDTNLTVFKIISNWSIENITYNNQPEIDNITLINTSSSENSGDLDNFNITDTIKAWHNNSIKNLGLSFRTLNESQDLNSVKYFSSDHSNNSKWPFLYIIYNQPIANQTLIAGTNITNAFDLDDYFYEPDGQTMTYTASETANTTLNITINSNNTVDIFSSSAYIGSVNVIFNASDGQNTTQSNKIIITTTGSGQTTTVTQSSSGGGGSSSRIKTAALSIIPEQRRTSVKEGETLEIALTLKNTGNVDLGKVTIEANSDKSGLNIRLSPENIGGLSINEETSMSVLIGTQEATEENYIITLKASVSSPILTESTAIVLDVITDAAKVKEQLDFAVDFFKNNPKCLELQELINKAEIKLEQKNYEEASTNIAIAIESCQNLLREEEPRLAKGRFSSLTTILISIGILTVVIISLYIGIKRLIPKKKATKRIGKKWW